MSSMGFWIEETIWLSGLPLSLFWNEPLLAASLAIILPRKSKFRRRSRAESRTKYANPVINWAWNTRRLTTIQKGEEKKNLIFFIRYATPEYAYRIPITHGLHGILTITRDDTTESSPNNKIHFRSRITKENISIKFFGQVPFRSADNEPVYNDRSELILAWLLTLPPILFLSSAHHSGNGDPPLNGHANNLSHPACPKCDAQIGLRT